jgi:hypothetical protein
MRVSAIVPVRSTTLSSRHDAARGPQPAAGRGPASSVCVHLMLVSRPVAPGGAGSARAPPAVDDPAALRDLEAPGRGSDPIGVASHRGFDAADRERGAPRGADRYGVPSSSPTRGVSSGDGHRLSSQYATANSAVTSSVMITMRVRCPTARPRAAERTGLEETATRRAWLSGTAITRPSRHATVRGPRQPRRVSATRQRWPGRSRRGRERAAPEDPDPSRITRSAARDAQTTASATRAGRSGVPERM